MSKSDLGWATLSQKSNLPNLPVKKHTLSTTEDTIIGRSPDCQIALEPHEIITVSRHHAKIRLVDGEWQIEDLGTVNGTLVNDRPIENLQKLSSGDRLTLGEKGAEFVFELAAKEMVASNTVDVPAAAIPAPLEPIAKEKTKLQSEAQPEPIINASIPKTTTPPPAVSPISVQAISSPNSGKTWWSLVSITEIAQFPGHSQPVSALAFSPDGQILASTAQDNTIKLSDVAKGVEIATLTGHKLAPNALAFSSDGKTIASAGADKIIKFWDLASQSETAFFSGHKGAINALAFSPDGQTLASGSADKTIKLWDLASQSETAFFSGHKDAIASLVYSLDGQILASGSKDKTLKLWNAARAEEMATLAGHAGISAISFSRDRQMLASAGSDQKIRLWNIQTQTEIGTISTPSWQRAMAIAADGQTFAGNDEQGIIRIWRI